MTPLTTWMTNIEIISGDDLYVNNWRSRQHIAEKYSPRSHDRIGEELPELCPHLLVVVVEEGRQLVNRERGRFRHLRSVIMCITFIIVVNCHPELVQMVLWFHAWFVGAMSGWTAPRRSRRPLQTSLPWKMYDQGVKSTIGLHFKWLHDFMVSD